MYEPLAPCPSCSRHVKTAESRCPFCRTALPEAFGGPLANAAATRGMSRAAALALGASLAVTGCGKTASQPTPEPVDAATQGTSSGGPNDNGQAVALYGAPPIDPPIPQVEEAGPPARRDGGPHDMGTMAPKYGGPPMRLKDGG